ncbi:MAG: 4Fe-4S dicluster domain-containing protein [Thermodesulfobacteriota bacterium]
MTEKKSKATTIIQINQGIVGPKPPLTKSLRIKPLGAYPDVAEAFRETARLYASPLLAGPPVCDELMDLIMHMFTEEEADIVRHFKPMMRMTAEKAAKASHRPVEDARKVLDRLSREKFILLAMGDGPKRKYTVMPILPGTFEAVMMATSMENLSDWQRRFAELFERLVETGYLTDYLKYDLPAVRYLPAHHAIEAQQLALPSDRLEEIMDRYKTFGVTMCQCGMTEILAGRGCGRPLENCVMFGEGVVNVLARAGKARIIEKKEAVEIKRQAEQAGLVSWIFNEESGKHGSSSCSCCGCCCHMMKTVTQYNMPAMIAPPRYLPVFDMKTCNHCAKCALRCPMGAITVDTRNKTHHHDLKRCVGCGQCVVACDKARAIAMEPVKEYRKPPGGYVALGARLTPNLLRSSLNAWRARR